MATVSPPIATVHTIPWWQRRTTRNYIIAFLFVLPALLNFTVFRYIPIFTAIYASFFEYSLLGGYGDFVMFDNYARALTTDPTFWASMQATIFYVVAKVPIQVFMALGLAVFTSQNKPGMGLMRSLIFVPVVTSYVVVSIVWGLILNKDFGLLNGILQIAGFPRFEYLTNLTWALPSIVAIAVWKDVGYSTIILVAGLKGIPDVYYEAAIVDGATPWQRFWHITLPLLRRPLLFVIVTTTLFAFQVFVPVYQLTQGGPARATMVIVYYIWRQGFKFGAMGYASALSIMLLIVILAISVVQMWLLRSDDDR